MNFPIFFKVYSRWLFQVFVISLFENGNTYEANDPRGVVSTRRRSMMKSFLSTGRKSVIFTVIIILSKMNFFSWKLCILGCSTTWIFKNFNFIIFVENGIFILLLKWHKSY